MNEALLRAEDAPEELELQKKQKLLQRLRSRLAAEEENLLEFQTELKEFETRYINEVGRLYADLDEIEAQIAEEEVKLAPDDEEILNRAQQWRERAAQSCHAADEASGCTQKYRPTTKVKNQYRDLARKVHPDLATDSEERELRHKIMLEANKAYEDGDEERLLKILEDWQSAPETIKGLDIGADLIRVIRQLAQIRKRLNILRDERDKLETSENNTLRIRVAEEMRAGRNLLKQMAERAKAHIKKADRRLTELRTNTAQLAEFKSFQVKSDWQTMYAEIDKEVNDDSAERYGMNISSLK